MTEANVLPPGFGEVDPDFMTKAYASAKKERSDTAGVVFLKTGITHVRVLPPHTGSPSWAYEFREHGLHPSGKFDTFICPKSISAKNTCPICEAGSALYDERTESSIKQAKRLTAKKAYLYNVYVHSSPDGNSLSDGIQVLKSGVTVYKQLMDYDSDVSGGWGDITNLVSGLEFRIDRQGKGRFETKYVVKPVPQRTNILEKLAVEKLEIGVPADLTKIYAPRTEEEMNEAMSTDEPPEE